MLTLTRVVIDAGRRIDHVMTVLTEPTTKRATAMPTLAPMQVLLHGSLAAPSSVDLVPNPDGRRSQTFNDPDEHAVTPRFGPHELIILAQEAQSMGFDVRRFEFVTDRNAPLLDDELEERAAAELVHVLRTGGEPEVTRLLTHELLPIIITGIVLFQPGVGQVTIRRGGVVFTRDSDSARELFTRHWRNRDDAR